MKEAIVWFDKSLSEHRDQVYILFVKFLNH